MAITWNGTAWVASTPYIVGARVVNAGGVYRCSVAGTSAASGSGPTSTADAAIVDGSATWMYKGVAEGEVLLLAPELGIAPKPTATNVRMQNQIIDAVENQMDPCAWGEQYMAGALNLAAHLATLTNRRGAPGPVTSEALGSMSQSFGVLMAAGLLAATGYGVEYQRLIYLLPTALGFVI